jgi:hypothetical protein
VLSIQSFKLFATFNFLGLVGVNFLFLPYLSRKEFDIYHQSALRLLEQPLVTAIPRLRFRTVVSAAMATVAQTPVPISPLERSVKIEEQNSIDSHSSFCDWPNEAGVGKSEALRTFMLTENSFKLYTKSLLQLNSKLQVSSPPMR